MGGVTDIETAQQGCAGQPFQRMLRGGGEIRQAVVTCSPTTQRCGSSWVWAWAAWPPTRRGAATLLRAPRTPVDSPTVGGHGGEQCVCGLALSLSESTCRSKIPAIRHRILPPPTQHSTYARNARRPSCFITRTPTPRLAGPPPLPALLAPLAAPPRVPHPPECTALRPHPHTQRHPASLSGLDRNTTPPPASPSPYIPTAAMTAEAPFSGSLATPGGISDPGLIKYESRAPRRVLWVLAASSSSSGTDMGPTTGSSTNSRTSSPPSASTTPSTCPK